MSRRDLGVGVSPLRSGGGGALAVRLYLLHGLGSLESPGAQALLSPPTVAPSTSAPVFVAATPSPAGLRVTMREVAPDDRTVMCEVETPWPDGQDVPARVASVAARDGLSPADVCRLAVERGLHHVVAYRRARPTRDDLLALFSLCGVAMSDEDRAHVWGLA